MAARTGRLTLVHRRDRRYEGNDVSVGSSVLQGQLDGRTFEGYWTAPAAPKPREVARGGSHHCGRIRLEFNADYNRFAGHWSYCEEARWSGNWTGKRADQNLSPESEPLPDHAT